MSFSLNSAHLLFVYQLLPGLEVCSRNNASYYVMLAHNLRGDYWWYGSRAWTLPPVFRYILLPWDIWQQRGRLAEWHLTRKCVWSRCVSLNSSVWKKWHSLTFTDSCWVFMEIKRWMWAQWGGGWYVSAVATAIRKSRVLDAHVDFYKCCANA